LDVAGQNVLALLHRAAEMGEKDDNHAVDIAHKLSHQLHDAQERIKDLEAELRHYQHRADRAEKWLSQIAAEIEQRFFAKADNNSTAAPAAPRKL
jgi:septal ring factor EnvC (AmiA/AmiB activator)